MGVCLAMDAGCLSIYMDLANHGGIGTNSCVDESLVLNGTGEGEPQEACDASFGGDPLEKVFGGDGGGVCDVVKRKKLWIKGPSSNLAKSDFLYMRRLGLKV